MSLVTSIPKTAIVLPSNVRVSQVGTQMVLQKIKRSRKKFKMSKKQRDRISAASRKFKIPILTGIAVAPAVILSVQAGLQGRGIVDQFGAFARNLLSFYTGVFITSGGDMQFIPQRLAVGWAPVAGIVVAKKFAKGTIMSINRALSQAQMPARLS